MSRTRTWLPLKGGTAVTLIARMGSPRPARLSHGQEVRGRRLTAAFPPSADGRNGVRRGWHGPSWAAASPAVGPSVALARAHLRTFAHAARCARNALSQRGARRTPSFAHGPSGTALFAEALPGPRVKGRASPVSQALSRPSSRGIARGSACLVAVRCVGPLLAGSTAEWLRGRVHVPAPQRPR